MTVRAWFTISALVLVALIAAVVYQFNRPASPPEIIVTAGDVRLRGGPTITCWPERSDQPSCRSYMLDPVKAQTLPREGTIRLVVAYPVQPEKGLIDISVARGKTMKKLTDWRRTVDYSLEPGNYELFAQANYPNRSYVAFSFPFRVR